MSGGTLLKHYPVIIQADRPVIKVKIQGGVGFVPIRFEGLASEKGYALYQLVNGKEVELDQSVHGNDFWQTDFDARTQTYARTYNIPLDGQADTQWRFKARTGN